MLNNITLLSISDLLLFFRISHSLMLFRMKLVEDAPKQQQQGPAPAVRLNGVNNGNGQVHNTTHREEVNNKRDNCVHANKSSLLG